MLHCSCCHQPFEAGNPDAWDEEPMCAPCNLGYCACGERDDYISCPLLHLGIDH